MTPVEGQMDILCFTHQGLSYRQVAHKTGYDRRTVKKYVEHPELLNQPRRTPPRGSVLDPYREQLKAWLQEDEHLRATTLYDRLVPLGYAGSYELVKCAVRALKAANRRIAYERFETEPGQQAQVDFAEFVVEGPDGTRTKLFLFTLILGYSRLLVGELLARCDLPSFLGALQRALQALGGAPREILFDRMRTVYIPGKAGAAAFTQGLNALALHYGFQPRVAPAYAAWVKGYGELLVM
jgi:transposase